MRHSGHKAGKTSHRSSRQVPGRHLGLTEKSSAHRRDSVDTSGWTKVVLSLWTRATTSSVRMCINKISYHITFTFPAVHYGCKRMLRGARWWIQKQSRRMRKKEKHACHPKSLSKQSEDSTSKQRWHSCWEPRHRTHPVLTSNDISFRLHICLLFSYICLKHKPLLALSEHLLNSF